VVRYILPDAAQGGGISATLSLYVDGAHQQDLELSSKYSWVYGRYPWSNDPLDGKAHRFFDETRAMIGELPAGAKLRLQKDASDTAGYYVIDLVELEQVAPAYAMPAGFISIADFGAVAGDGQDDSAALVAAIAQARISGAGVWIPAGTFEIASGPLDVDNVTIRGAGMWHSVLSGRGAAFAGKGDNIRLYDFAIDGATTERIDSAPETGLDGNAGTGSTVQQVWIEHVKVGIWLNAPTDGAYIAGCRVRNTFADGMNISGGTRNTLVEQCQVRNTGDDGLAIWSAPWISPEPSSNNTLQSNTVQLPWLASNIAVYGGAGNKVLDNLVQDTVAFGAGIMVSSRHNPVPFSGTTIVERNTLLRTGGREHNWNVDLGALWLFASDQDMDARFSFRHNNILDSSYAGISIQGPMSLANTLLEGVVVDGAGTWGLQVTNNARGDLLYNNLIMRNPKVGQTFNGAGASFEIRELLHMYVPLVSASS
jgi:hypothetical protein